MKNIFAILFLSACSLLGQAMTPADPAWPYAYVTAAAGGGGGCTTSNLWSSPINQQQLTDAAFSNAGEGSFYCQKIRNTSGSAVKIKKFRYKTQSQGVGDVSVYAMARTASTAAGGTQYGNNSGSIVVPSGQAAQFQEFIFSEGDEPEIPANTDFFIGMVAAASNLVMSRRTSTDLYESGDYCFYTEGSQFLTRDAVFEIYICD